LGKQLEKQNQQSDEKIKVLETRIATLEKNAVERIVNPTPHPWLLEICGYLDARLFDVEFEVERLKEQLARRPPVRKSKKPPVCGNDGKTKKR